MTPDDIRKVREALATALDVAARNESGSFAGRCREALSLLDAALNQEGGEANPEREPRPDNTTPRQAEPSVGADHAELVRRLKAKWFFSDELMAARALSDEHVIALYRSERKEAAHAIETLVWERDEARSLLQDPMAVRLNILRGGIAIPTDLVWLHDTNGPVAELRDRATSAERERDEARGLVKQARDQVVAFALDTWTAEQAVRAVDYLDEYLARRPALTKDKDNG